MQRATAYRLLVAAIWGIFLLTVTVCGIGLYLTANRYRDMRGTLLAAEKRAAENQLRRLQDFIEREETAALASLVDAGPDAPSLATILETHPFLKEPFFILTDGTLVLPHLRRLNAPPPLLEDEVLPSDFEDALRLSFSQAAVAEKLEAFEKVSRSAELGDVWRLRARIAMAALHQRYRRPRKAAAIYRSVLEDFGSLLERMRSPSHLHVSLGCAEALADMRDRKGTRGVLTAALERLEKGERRPTLDEEEFFLERSEEVFTRFQLPLPEGFAKARAALAAERTVINEAEKLRHWIEDRIRLESENPVEEKPRHLSTRSSGQLVPTVWNRVDPSLDDAGLLAAGFRVDIDALQSLLEGQLEPGVQADALNVVLAEREIPEDHEVLAAMPGDLGFIRILLDRDLWEDLVGDHRKPFVFAGALILLLGFILLSSLVIIFRGVWREHTLSRMKTEFVANVSHELKTPLALVRMCAETLLLGRLRDNAQRDKYLHVITRESERLGHLISNVLDFSSIEAGKKTYDRRVIDIAPVVRRTLDNYRFELEEKGFEQAVDLPASLPPVLADDEAVTQALINLLQNAVRYSTGTREIEVAAGAVANEVRVSVADHGVGIPRDDQKRIWDDYYRSGEARALGTRGSGLGLSLVQHIMNAHDGHVELVSEPGEGSTFTLVFPIARDESREVSDEREDPDHRG